MSAMCSMATLMSELRKNANITPKYRVHTVTG